MEDNQPDNTGSAEPQEKTKKKRPPGEKRPKVLGLKQVFQKTHRVLIKFAEKLGHYFGDVEDCCIIFIWGKSGHGKSELVMQLVTELCNEGKLLYVALEEGVRLTMVQRIKRYLTTEAHNGIFQMTTHEMRYEELMKYLAKKGSPKIIVIDSIQYWRISYEQYTQLKERFPKKIFIFISHAEGMEPKGATAKDIRYDADIKIRVEGKIGFVDSRYGGNKNYVIWEEGAKKYWGGKLFNKHKNR
jgi:pantothenate kinase-related protein Tda10